MDIIVQQASNVEFEFEELLRVDLEAWGEDLIGGEHLIRSPLKIFPEGYFVASVDGTPAGSFTTMMISYDLDNPVATWEEVSSDGWFTNHDPIGNALYGVSLGVSARYQGLCSS